MFANRVYAIVRYRFDSSDRARTSTRARGDVRLVRWPTNRQCAFTVRWPDRPFNRPPAKFAGQATTNRSAKRFISASENRCWLSLPMPRRFRMRFLNGTELLNSLCLH